MYLVNEVLFIYHSLLTLYIYAIFKIYTIYISCNIYSTYISCRLFSFFRTQPGIELGHPRTLFPDDVIRNTIGHVGHPICVVKDVLFIYHTLLTLHIYAIYIYNMDIRYILYILHKRYIIHIKVVFFFSFFRTKPGIEPGHPRTTMLSVTPSVT